MIDQTQTADTPDDIVGHKTFRRDDGGFYHEPLRRAEAEAVMAECDAKRLKRERDMPDERAAIDALFESFQRLRELGWREAIYCPKDGTPFKAIEAGSTGIHPCFYMGDWPTGSWMVGDGMDCGPSHPILFKLHPEDEARRQAKMAEAAARFRKTGEAEHDE